MSPDAIKDLVYKFTNVIYSLVCVYFVCYKVSAIVNNELQFALQCHKTQL